VKRSIMEMSGNGPTVVTADANLAAAATAAVYGAYYNSGQVCCATERVIVLDAVHDEFVEAVLKASEVVRLGDPFDPDTNMGPLNNAPPRRRWIDISPMPPRSRRAGRRGPGRRIPPTLLPVHWGSGARGEPVEQESRPPGGPHPHRDDEEAVATPPHYSACGCRVHPPEPAFWYTDRSAVARWW
jgi:hypothetical protein